VECVEVSSGETRNSRVPREARVVVEYHRPAGGTDSEQREAGDILEGL